MGRVLEIVYRAISAHLIKKTMEEGSFSRNSGGE
jgi:hypothetical protein